MSAYPPLTKEQLDYARTNRVGIRTLQRRLQRGGNMSNVFWDERDVSLAALYEEIERLKANYEQLLAMYDRSRARVEELEGRLAMPEHTIESAKTQITLLEQERDKLRLKLQNTEEYLKAKMNSAAKEFDQLRAELEVRESELSDALVALKRLTQPKQPTIVHTIEVASTLGKLVQFQVMSDGTLHSKGGY